MSYKARANHDFKEIVVATRIEAENVLEELDNMIQRYGTASVSSFYNLVGVTGDYTDNKWGWNESRGFDIQRVREGYLLDLPKPEPID